MRRFTTFLFTCIIMNKDILEYAQILVTSGRFMIFHIEGHFNKYRTLWNRVLWIYIFKKGALYPGAEII